MCRKYWFEEYCPKPQGGINFPRGTNNVLHARQILLKSLYFGLAILQKNMRISMAVFMGTAQDNVQILQTFLGGFVRDKIGINSLLRPLLWVLKLVGIFES